MNRTTHYLFDLYGRYLGTVQSPANQALPERSTVIAPPQPTPAMPYQIYVGGGWELRDELSTVRVYDRNWDFGWIITTNAFAQRFSFPEQVALQEAQADEANPYRFAIRALMAALDRATFADLTRPEYTDAMQLFYAIGILTAERVNEIHNTKGAWDELPQWRQAELITKGYVPQ